MGQIIVLGSVWRVTVDKPLFEWMMTYFKKKDTRHLFSVSWNETLQGGAVIMRKFFIQNHRKRHAIAHPLG